MTGLRERRRLGLSAAIGSLTVGSCTVAPVTAQPSLALTRLDQTAVLDGVIADEEWSEAAVIDKRFVQLEPSFGETSMRSSPGETV